LYNIHIQRRIVKRTTRCVECALQEQFGLKINYTGPGIHSNNFTTPKHKNPEERFLDISKWFEILPGTYDKESYGTIIKLRNIITFHGAVRYGTLC
jgi:hypothetical protein